MKSFSCYAIQCARKDEKILAARVNEYLATNDRTMSKTKNASLLQSRLPFVYKHYYWNLNKGAGTYFELVPNADEEGKLFSDTHANCGWIIVIRIDVTHPAYSKTETESFIQGVLKAIGFELVTVYETDVEPE